MIKPSLNKKKDMLLLDVYVFAKIRNEMMNKIKKDCTNKIQVKYIEMIIYYVIV